MHFLPKKSFITSTPDLFLGLQLIAVVNFNKKCLDHGHVDRIGLFVTSMPVVIVNPDVINHKVAVPMMQVYCGLVAS